MKTIGWMAAFLSWNAAVAWASPPAGKDREIVEGWVLQALADHPQARTAGLGVESERVQVEGTRAWMPPFVELDDQSDGLADVKLTQMIPWPGKTRAMETVQRDKVGMAQADSSDIRRGIELAVREAAWMEWMNGAKARLLEEQEGVVRDLARTAERNQAQGLSTAADTWILRARTEQVQAQADQAQAEAASAKAMREGWTGPVRDALEDPSRPQPPAWDDSALADSVKNRPDIVAMLREATMREAMGRASEVTLRPDLMVGAMAMRMQNGMPGWGLMAGFTVPFAPWSSGMANGQTRGARVQARAAQSKAEAMVRMARSEVADHSQRARAAWASWKRLDSLVLPGEENALALTRIRYGQGSEMLSMVLAMEEMIRMTRMDAVMQRGTYELERARLAAAAGVEPDRLEGLK